MKKTLLTLIASMALALPAVAQTTQFRGYAETERILGERLLLRGKNLSLYHYAFEDFGLMTLLGSWQGLASVTVFTNGLPNSVNMLIWYSALSGLAEDLAASCDRPNPYLPFNPRFQKALAAICAWPAESAKTEEAMMDYWLGIMGYSAPEEEYEAWRSFALATYKDRTAREAVKAMSFAILLNPFLLLQD